LTSVDPGTWKNVEATFSVPDGGSGLAGFAHSRSLSSASMSTIVSLASIKLRRADISSSC
jgi:hypothetical protein